MMYTQLDIEQNRKKTGRELCFTLLAALPFAALAVAAFWMRREVLCMAAVVLCGGVIILLWDLFVSPCRRYGRYLSEVTSGLTRRTAGTVVRLGEDRVFRDGVWFNELILNIYEDLSEEGEQRYLYDCAKERPEAFIGKDVALTSHGNYVLDLELLHADGAEEEDHA